MLNCRKSMCIILKFFEKFCLEGFNLGLKQMLDN